MTRARQALGEDGEARAERFLADLGWAVLERRYRTPFGELDLVAKDGAELVFVEVKARSSGAFGSPQEAVTAAKQKRMTKAALSYLKRFGLTESPLRFDVVAVAGEKIEHIRDAFSPGGYTR